MLNGTGLFTPVTDVLAAGQLSDNVCCFFLIVDCIYFKLEEEEGKWRRDKAVAFIDSTDETMTTRRKLVKVDTYALSVIGMCDTLYLLCLIGNKI